MIKLRKFAVTILAALTLAGCNATEASGSVKSYLLNHGFDQSNIITMTAENYKKTQPASLKADGLKEYLVADKPAATASELPEQFYCWFFDTFDQADAFVKEYVGSMYVSLEGKVKDPTMGSRNNAAYAGTQSIAVGLGWIITA